MRDEAVRRAALIFKLFDANGNGVLDPQDFGLVADRVLVVATDSAQEDRQTFAGSMHQWWDVLAGALDADNDGLISPQEFEAFVLDPERFAPTADLFANALATLGDPDNDGLIERTRFLDLMIAWGFDAPNIHALFDAFEPDAADRITVTAWADGIRDYYTPGLAGIPGDRLVSLPV
ncbi:EF-hand domain-containing protein [Streptomyces sp. CBMA156]|uniref:EF-hand domain-containing protein n=1 Tax=Streptomyces sp. CBMA156 TaxID=1930280 RepID=UPI001661C444|nr:EF-hand domain-containing protein [Streptomyces sp. CBMA156]MBD0675147.1 calcium-binding protein [Streptomyces sp. CBMA156]